MSRAGWTAYLAWQKRGQAGLPFAPPEQVHRAQLRRLRQIVRHAWKTVPYYHEEMSRLGLRPKDIHSLEALRWLPLIGRADVQRAPLTFVSTARPVESYAPVSLPDAPQARLYWDPEALLQTAALFERVRPVIRAYLGRWWTRWREAVIDTADTAAARLVEFAEGNTLFGARRRRVRFSLQDSPAEVAERLSAFQTNVLFSRGPYLETLFGYLKDSGRRFHRPSLILCTSDGVSEAIRRVITQDFRIPLLPWYSAAEAPDVAYPCERGGLHVNADLYPLRVVDPAGREVRAGQTGELVVSNLVNRATVLLNYRLGDLACLPDADCPCGRRLPLLRLLPARADERVRLPSGRVLEANVFRDVLNQEPAVWQYQVTQTAPDRFRVSLVASAAANRQEIVGRLKRHLAEAIAENAGIELVFVERLEPLPSGRIPVVRTLPISPAPGAPAEE